MAMATAAVLGLVLTGSAEQSPKGSAPKGEADFRAGWNAFAAPAADPEKARSLEARQQARMAAIPLLEAAIAAGPSNWAYRESLAYVCLSAGQYEKAKAAIDKAIEMKRDRPVLYMLRGQAEAALAQMDPPTAAERIGPAITAFDRAAELDQSNALPLLQAASVAFDVNRSDLALPRIQKALQRPGAMLYALDVPTNLSDQPGLSIRAWQYMQLGHWYELLARFRNVSTSLLGRGQKLEQANDLGGADGNYRQSLQVGRLIGGMRPHLFINVAAAVDVMYDSYQALSGVAAKSVVRGQMGDIQNPTQTDYVIAAKSVINQALAASGMTSQQACEQWGALKPAPVGLDDPVWTLGRLTDFYVWLATRQRMKLPQASQDLARWQGESGVLAFARSQLAAGLEVYVKEIAKLTSPTVEQMLATEESILSPVIAGIGLNPTGGEASSEKPKPAGKPRPSRGA
jgi:hypothetical protein